jgi:hypothetical protein
MHYSARVGELLLPEGTASKGRVRDAPINIRESLRAFIAD